MEDRCLLAGDLIGHWLADDLNDVVESGEPVESWPDSVGGIQATAIGAPLLIKEAHDQHSVVRFTPRDGDDGFRVAAVDSPMSGIGDFSIVVVFSTESPGRGVPTLWFQNSGIVDATRFFGATSDWGVVFNATGQVGAGSGGPATTIYSSESSLHNGLPHVAVYSQGGGHLSLYVDGGEPVTAEGGAGPRDVVDMTFGMLQSGALPFTGEIAEIRFYDGELSAADVQRLTRELFDFYTNIAPPKANDDNYSVDEDAAITVDVAEGVLANDFDEEMDDFVAVLVEPTSHGALDLSSDGSFSYEPNADFFGTDTFTYLARDADDSNVATVTIQVRPLYDPARAVEDNYLVDAGAPLQVSPASGVLANDVNPDQVALKALLVDDVEYGDLTLREDGSFDYDPLEFVGVTTFTYQVRDLQAIQNTVTVTLLVDTAPVALPESYDVVEDTRLVIGMDDGLLVNDSDADGDSLLARVTVDPRHGTVQLSDDGSFLYEPDPDYFGPDAFVYVASDGDQESEPATVTFRVEAVNDAPVAVPDRYLALPNHPLVFTAAEGVLANDVDVDSSFITAALIDPPRHGTLTFEPDGSFTYLPDSEFEGEDIFTYEVTDAIAQPAKTNAKLYINLFDELEERSGADAVVTFNEVMYNPTGVHGEWIELYNQMSVDVDVSGWSLQGGVEYTIPAGTVLPAGGFLLVAENPDALERATGFGKPLGPYRGRLSNGGEEIRLFNRNRRVMDTLDYDDEGLWPVGPDGSGASLAKKRGDTASGPSSNWVTSAQVGGTPGQVNFADDANVSRVFTNLTKSDSEVAAHVPSDGSLGDAWKDVTFDDSAWTRGTLAVGYDSDGPIPHPPSVGALRAYWSFDEDWSDSSGNGHDGSPTGTAFSTDVPTALGRGKSLSLSGANEYVGAFVDVSEVSYTASLWFKTGATSRGIFGVVDGPLGSGGHDRHLYLNGQNVATRLWDTEVIRTSDQNYTDQRWHHLVHVFGGDVGGQRLYVDGQLVASGSKTSSNFDGQTQVTIGFSNDGARHFFQGEIDDVSLWDEALSEDAIQALYRGTSPLELASFSRMIGTNIGVAMEGINASSYVRIPFEAAEGAFDQLTMNIRFDDGFVAYLNGAEVARANAPDALSWNARATADRTDAMAGAPQAFDLTPFLDRLRQGTNVLAIHGLNASATDSDFFVSPELQARVALPKAFQADLAFNEVASADDSSFSVEIVNFGAEPLSLQAMVLASTEGRGAEFSLPDRMLGAGEYLTFSAEELNLDPEPGDKLFLYAPDRISVLDAVVVRDRRRGRSPDGTGAWLYPDMPTPDAANHFALQDAIVINELLYQDAPFYSTGNAPFQPSFREWIELYNRGPTTVDLSGWSIAGGIQYEFASGVRLAPDSYLVVAKDADVLRVEYPSINIVGNFSGSLNNATDTVILRDNYGNPADEVTYFDGGRWPEAAGGGGASLELRDPRADNSKAEAWAASNQIQSTKWGHYRYSGVVEKPVYDPPIHFHEFVMGLLDAGEILIDNLSVVKDPRGEALELLQNGTFESDTLGKRAAKWRIQGTHDRSRVVEDPDVPGNHVLRLIADGRANYLANHAETTLAHQERVIDGVEYEISFDARWISGSPQLRTELYYNDLARVTVLDTPEKSGTPGAVNSVREANIGPTYAYLRHGPVIPDAFEDVTVSVDAEDPDGIESMTLWYALDGMDWESVSLRERSDGHYAGIVPGRPAGSVVQFYVEGRDSLGATSMFPAAGPHSRALIKFEDGLAVEGPRHNFRIVMTTEDANALHAAVNILSNQRRGATVYYNERDVFYDVGVRLRGSMFSRSNQAGTGFNVRFQPDHLFRGIHESVTMKTPGKREILVKHLAVQAGLPGMYDDIVYLNKPTGSGDGIATLSMARHGDVFVESQFDGGQEGTVFKMEGIRVMLNNTGAENLKTYMPVGWVANYDLTDLGDDKELYRWSIQINRNRARDDYSRIVDMAKSLSLSGQALQDATAEVLDVDEWMRTFALMSLAGIGDVYSQGNPHNLNFYVRPADNKVIAMPWDWDFTFNRSTTAPLWGGKNISKVIELPVYTRLFYGHLHDMIQTVFNTEYMEHWTQHYGKIAGESYGSHLAYIRQRANYVESMLPEAIPFELTTNGGNDIVVDDVAATLEGRGWIDVREIRLAGSSQPLKATWLDGERWQLTVPVKFGDNLITLEAYDFSGNVVGSDTIRIGSTVDTPTVDNSLRVSEINFHPHDAVPGSGEINADAGDFEFIELANVGSQPLDLDGVQLDGGIRFTFASQILESGGRVVVVKDRAAFASRYGSDIALAAGNDGQGGDAGEFAGQLSNAGEQLRLLNASGQIIQQFGYDDWYAATDGEGSSLELIDPANPNLDAWNRRESWRASAQKGGTPGSIGQGQLGDMDGDGSVGLADVTSFARGLIDPQQYIAIYGLPPAVNGDVDGDGDFDFDDIPAFVKLLGVNPLNASSSTAASVPRDVDTYRADGIPALVDGWSRNRQASTDLALRDETFRSASSFSRTHAAKGGRDDAISSVARREWLSGADRVRWTRAGRRAHPESPLSMEENLAAVWSNTWDWLER